MPVTIRDTWWKAARCGAVAAIVFVAAGCEAPPSAPSPTPTPSPTPSARPLGLNTVFIAAPAVPPSSDTNTLPGRYRLEIEAEARSGPRCELVPAYAHRREYTADIHSLGDRYAVKLYDATFLADTAKFGYGCSDSRLPQTGPAVCHQFLLTGDPDALSLTLEPLNEWRGTEIWEDLSDGFVLQILGRAIGAVRDGRIEATGTGGIWYGNGLPASTSYYCQSDALKFTFSRR